MTRSHALFSLLALGVLSACSGAKGTGLCSGSACRDGGTDDDVATGEDRGPAEDGGAATEDGEVGSEDAAQAGDGGGGGEACTPGDLRCAADRLELCGSRGDGWIAQTCGAGCDDTTDPPSCRPESLAVDAGWQVVLFPLVDDSQTAQATYEVASSGVSATQTVNGNPSAYVNERVLENVRISGRFGVSDPSDDDLIGFVFGYQDDAHFYLFDWKQASQDDSTCGASLQGFSLKRVSANAKPSSCLDFWASAGSGNVTVLASAADHPTPWSDPAPDTVFYDFVLSHVGEQIQITVSQGGSEVLSLSVSDGTYPRGQFGFYNYSQAGVVYELFRFEPADG